LAGRDPERSLVGDSGLGEPAWGKGRKPGAEELPQRFGEIMSW